MTKMRMLSDGQLYLYSAIAQIAGALIGLGALGLTFGAQKMRGLPRRAMHAYRALRAGSGLLLGVVVASSVVLFDEGRSSGVRVSRWILSVSTFFLVGGITHHYWTAPRDGKDELDYQKWRRRGWLATVVGTALSVLYGAVWLPRYKGAAVSSGDLGLMLFDLTGGLILAFLAIVQFVLMDESRVQPTEAAASGGSPSPDTARRRRSTTKARSSGKKQR
jgi:hypothetical protein